MKKFYALPLLFMAMVFAAACAQTAYQKPATVLPAVKQVRTVYVWDADGYSDLALLRGLKAEAAKALKEKGLIVIDDPSETEAYVKVTVIDAGRDADAGKSYVRARLYVVDAADNSIIYDKTAGASASGGGNDGPAYPVERIIKELLADYPGVGGK